MKKMRRVLAATLALTVLFATSVMAQQTPREIIGQAYANSAEATTSSITGNIAGTIFMMGMELLQLNIDFAIDMDINLETGEMMMYMRMPMQISGADPLTGQPMNENIEVAVFMDGSTMFVYESTIGWFTDPSMDFDMDMLGFDLTELEEMTAMFMELNEQVMDQITIQFAADNDAFPGYYVIEQFMDFDDFMNMMDAIFTADFFEEIMAATLEEELAGLSPAEVDMIMAELDEVMDMLAAILDEIEIDMQMVYRSYIDVDTLEFSRYLMTMTLDFAADLDLGIMGSLDISGSFTMDFDMDYNPTITWPVIGDVATLDDIIGGTATFYAIDTTTTVELVLGDADLEERYEGFFNDGETTTGFIELMVEDVANLNVFIVNHGAGVVTIALEGVFAEVLQPGGAFVLQIPAGTLAADAFIVVDGAGAPLDVETGFRLTNYPLSSH